jgi:hypothetical protein
MNQRVKRYRFLLYFVSTNTHPLSSREEREGTKPQDSTDRHSVRCFPRSAFQIFRQNVIKSPIPPSLNTDNRHKNATISSSLVK